MATPTALVSASSAVPAVASNSTVRISTGVVAPQIVRSVSLDRTVFGLDRAVATNAHMTVKLTVDEQGKPHGVTVVDSINPVLDSAVVDAVSHYQFRPGTLNSQPIAVPMQLTVQFAAN